MDFIAPEEEYALKLCYALLDNAKQLKLNKTERYLGYFINKRERTRFCGPNEFGVCLELFLQEIIDQYPHQKKSVMAFEKLVQEYSIKLKVDGIKLDLSKANYKPDEFSLIQNTAETLMQKTNSNSDDQTKILLDWTWHNHSI